MGAYPQFQQAPPQKKSRGCLTCLIIFGAVLLLLACLIFLVPVILRSLGVFGRSAEYLYQQSPDIVSSQMLKELIEERNIEGVSVYVIPIMKTDEKGAFIILDSSRGYTGLSPLDDDNEIFFDLLKDLVRRDQDENLRIAHLTVEYRDEQAVPFFSFTVAQDVVQDYVSGLISDDEFYGLVEFNTVDTLRNLGLDELLDEVQP